MFDRASLPPARRNLEFLILLVFAYIYVVGHHCCRLLAKSALVAGLRYFCTTTTMYTAAVFVERP